MDQPSVQAVAALLQARPDTTPTQLSVLFGCTEDEAKELYDKLMASGIAADFAGDPHGLHWAKDVSGPTDGPLGRMRLAKMLAAVQKGTLAALAERVLAVLDGSEKMSATQLARVLREVGDQLHLERGEGTSASAQGSLGALGAAQQSTEALSGLIDRLAADRQAVLDGRRIPGVS